MGLEPVLRILILSFSFLAVCAGVYYLTVAFCIIKKIRGKKDGILR
jgi:hypothetical protein